ncbi:uncharacterized protein LOC126884965 [Diabrotica virgifera virgifera]|uniref:CCHC-type domain-containing protein n=1 Tax=Diabrotica virgifera virgifera TaxID=50390 RepID=A0ABM5KAU0_DIAVI|nr:uncharacterized protein LOC126884965 [Diabrotica virgifera virgifera]
MRKLKKRQVKTSLNAKLPPRDRVESGANEAGSTKWTGKRPFKRDRVRVRNPKSLTQDELRAMAEALFEEEPEEEVRGEEDASSSEEEEEITEDNDYNTESEIELNDKESSDSDNESDGESLESDEDEYFIAKDKQTKWYKNSVSFTLDFDNTIYRIFISQDSLVCFRCKKPGHIASQCSEPLAQLNPNQNNEASVSSATNISLQAPNDTNPSQCEQISISNVPEIPNKEDASNKDSHIINQPKRNFDENISPEAKECEAQRAERL